MSMEVEAKAYAEDLKTIENELIEKGAKFVWKGTQKDTYFNHPARDFAETDEALRIREVDGRAFFTYKGPKIDSVTKTREEIKVQLENGDSVKIILEKLGFSEVGTVKKDRKRYRFDEFTVCLDLVDKLGSFIELEAVCNSEDTEEISRLRDNILKTLQEWGLDKIERRSYLELLFDL